MYHSLTFYDGTHKYNTYDDWHLVPETRPVVVPPEPKFKYLDLPGGHGQIDLTESLTGYPIYNNREGEWVFYVLNDFGNWNDRLSEIMTAIQGKKLKVVLEDDIIFSDGAISAGNMYRYLGRFYVSDWDSSEGSYSKITITYNVEPYKVRCREIASYSTVYLQDTNVRSL